MAILNNKKANINRKLPVNEQQMGVDLKIDDAFDLLVNNLQDFALTAGMPNAAQGLLLKLLTEPGGNKIHPEIAVNLPIGEKTVDAITLQVGILRSLSTDPRYENVNASVQIIGNIYFIDISVFVDGRSITIPLQVVANN